MYYKFRMGILGGVFLACSFYGLAGYIEVKVNFVKYTYLYDLRRK